MFPSTHRRSKEQFGSCAKELIACEMHQHFCTRRRRSIWPTTTTLRCRCQQTHLSVCGDPLINNVEERRRRSRRWSDKPNWKLRRRFDATAGMISLWTVSSSGLLVISYAGPRNSSSQIVAPPRRKFLIGAAEGERVTYCGLRIQYDVGNNIVGTCSSRSRTRAESAKIGLCCGRR